MLTGSGCINVIDVSQLDDDEAKGKWHDLDEDVLTGMFQHLHTEDEVAELDPRLCFAPYGIDEDWYSSRFEGFPPEYYSILAGLHRKALEDAEVLERKEEKIKLLEDEPEEKIEEVE